MLFGVLPVWSFILVKKGRLSKLIFLSVLIISIFVILNYLSRQVIVLLLLSFLVSYTFYNKIQIRKLIVYSLLIVGVFFLIGQIRISQLDSLKKTSGYTANKMLKDYTGIKSETNLIESTYILYSSIRYNVLNDFINRAKKDHYHGYGKYIFRQLVSVTFLDRVGLIHYEDDYNVNAALPTYAIDPYLDFGILGVICFGFFYGIISTHFYTNYKLKKEQYIISWSLVIFCLIMSPFMNYFSSFFIFFVWGLNKLIISE
jgi:oligosaccharide repeat unit polymerase